MSTEITETKSTGVSTARVDVMKTHPMYTTFKSLKKASPAAVEILEEGMRDADIAVRLKSAELLLKFYTQTSKSIMDDSLQQIALQAKIMLEENARNNGGQIAPLVDFSRVRNINE